MGRIVFVGFINFHVENLYYSIVIAKSRILHSIIAIMK